MTVRGLCPLLQVFDMPTSYGMRHLNVTDPNGYGLCLQWPAKGEGVGL
jgi:hypothetical protein